MYETNSDHRIGLFRELLAAHGLRVNEGETGNVDSIENFDKKIIDSAAGNNAGQPYKAFLFAESNDKENPVSSFKMKLREAIIYIGRTPPAADYFSFTPYLHVRKRNALYEKGDWVFAALGDPLNSAVIQTENDGDDNSPFAKQTLIIFTADEETYKCIQDIALKAGFPKQMINLYIIPSSLLYMGTSKAADSLLILLRTANYKSKDDQKDYLENNEFATVLRVTPKASLSPSPFPICKPKNRKYKNEALLIEQLLDALHCLEEAIVKNTSFGYLLPLGSIRWFSDSFDVLQEKNLGSPLYHKFVAGECSDTTYLRTSSNGTPVNFLLGKTDMVVVYGVNHVATGLATYASFGVYGDWISSSKPSDYIFGCNDYIWNGVAGMTSHNYVNSASEYLPDHPLAKYLYAVRVMRPDCVYEQGKYCVIVPTSEQNSNSGKMIAIDKPVIIGYRAYLNPHTLIGPDYEDIIHDKAIVFGTSSTDNSVIDC